MTVRWSARALSGLNVIFDRLAEDDPQAAHRVVGVLVEMSEMLDTFPQARGQPIAGTSMREVVDRRWKRYAVRFEVVPDGTVLIVDIRRIRPFPSRHFVP